MAVDLNPDLWFDQTAGGAATPLVTTGVAGTGAITIKSGDATTGVPGLDLTGAGAGNDSAHASRIIKAILEQMYQYQESLATADKPTTMVITRSTTTSGTSMYMTYSLRFTANTTTLEAVNEP